MQKSRNVHIIKQSTRIRITKIYNKAEVVVDHLALERKLFSTYHELLPEKWIVKMSRIYTS